VRSADGKEIGRITSTAFSPRLNRAVALGLIKYDFLADGTEAIVVSDDAEHRARIKQLPLVAGGWQETSAPENEA
jgi:glycine cleavage system aminomethyltransferase T